ncbi:DUF4349 domain-containing protein [Dactylosporangium sp. NPDC051485]|uniref:DUF4349 domain-containing protein n=1 Tax=Dactylosporangium sp. NPDC051485 TaxID=3154846 RepID=UPI003440600B
MSVRRTGLLLTAAVLAVLALGGCSAASSDTPSSGAAAPQQGTEVNAAAGAGPAADVPRQQQDPAQQKAPEIADDRAIIYSGTITLEAKNVNDAATKALAFAAAAGGFVGSDNRQIDGDGSTATLILRVPAEKFNSTLEQVKTIGEEENRQLSAQDVTDQVADVESRLKTAQASVNRIRELMAKAQTIGEITSLESELARRESDLESLQARKRRLDGLTALSTITVVLHGPKAPAVSTKDTGITVGLRNGWGAFVASLRVALTVLGWLLPWIVFLGLPIYLLTWIWRRYRATPRKPPVSAVAEGAEAEPTRAPEAPSELPSAR